MPRALTIKRIEGKPGKVYYPLSLDTIPDPTPSPHDLTVQIRSCALNHRDHFIRQHLYPGIAFSTALCADGCGTVTGVGAATPRTWLGKRVLLTPGRGWAASRDGPESARGAYSILGASKYLPGAGTAQDVVCVAADEVEEAPEHLSDAQAAALPLAGLTAWRAVVVKSGNALPGRNILVTGVGGGVAGMAVLFAVGCGCRVFVTSGSAEKIERAKELGVVGGVCYRDVGWEMELLRMLPKERPLFDAIIDGAGGDVCSKAVKILKSGGVIVTYGMTLAPQMDWVMGAVMKNIELRGSTMGSRKEFKDMVQFVRHKKITPVVSRVVKGLDNLPEIESLFEDMKRGTQFGKLVIEVSSDALRLSKL